MYTTTSISNITDNAPDISSTGTGFTLPAGYKNITANTREIFNNDAGAIKHPLLCKLCVFNPANTKYKSTAFCYFAYSVL